MKRKIGLSLIICLAVTVLTVLVSCPADLPLNNVSDNAKNGDSAFKPFVVGDNERYATLQQAVDSLVGKTGGPYTIKLTSNVFDGGATINGIDANLNLDFGDYNYVLENAIKGIVVNSSDVKIIGGKIKVSGDTLTTPVITSYSNLTLEGTKINSDDSAVQVLDGEVLLQGATVITSKNSLALDIKDFASVSLTSPDVTLTGGLNMEGDSELVIKDGKFTVTSITLGDSVSVKVDDKVKIEVSDEDLDKYSSKIHFHTWQLVRNENPKCTEDGYKLFICEKCKEEKTVVLEALGHKWKYSEDTSKVATCTDDGCDEYICEHDSSHVRQDTIPATGHDYVGEIVGGSTVYTCSKCGDEYIEYTNTVIKDVISSLWNDVKEFASDDNISSLSSSVSSYFFYPEGLKEWKGSIRLIESSSPSFDCYISNYTTGVVKDLTLVDEEGNGFSDIKFRISVKMDGEEEERTAIIQLNEDVVERSTFAPIITNEDNEVVTDDEETIFIRALVEGLGSCVYKFSSVKYEYSDLYLEAEGDLELTLNGKLTNLTVNGCLETTLSAFNAELTLNLDIVDGFLSRKSDYENKYDITEEIYNSYSKNSSEIKAGADKVEFGLKLTYKGEEKINLTVEISDGTFTEYQESIRDYDYASTGDWRIINDRSNYIFDSDVSGEAEVNLEFKGGSNSAKYIGSISITELSDETVGSVDSSVYEDFVKTLDFDKFLNSGLFEGSFSHSAYINNDLYPVSDFLADFYREFRNLDFKSLVD